MAPADSRSRRHASTGAPDITNERGSQRATDSRLQSGGPVQHHGERAAPNFHGGEIHVEAPGIAAHVEIGGRYAAVQAHIEQLYRDAEFQTAAARCHTRAHKLL